MTLRLKLRGDKKAMIRFGDQLEEQWFVNLMRSIRDSDPRTHPAISIKDKGGEIPKLPKPKPEVKIDPGKTIEKKTGEMSKRITPEEYLEESKQGKCCAVVGCLAKPSEKCPGCGAHYCNEHIKIHSHVVEKEVKK